MPKAARLAAICCLILAHGPAATAADAILIPGDELIDPARAFVLPAPGRYTVKAWGSPRLAWSTRADGPTLTLTSKTAIAATAPRWVTVGSIEVASGGPIEIHVATDDPGIPPVPTFLSLATDPDFEPSLALVRGQIASTAPALDARRSRARTNQEGADFEPPATASAWRDRSKAVREQLLVALGLWPMPPKTDLHARVVGTLGRDGYSIDKVVLETLPGFPLAGNLYRPTAPATSAGRRPLVLCPHGHWDEGRFLEDVQARCARLARLGCVVFLYDMAGYGDGKAFGHAFMDDRLRRWGLSLVTLQAWNSIRALDWLLARPDVDPARVAITGESGGATQALLLTAIDPRIKVSAPVVMVSDGFQGGCACENAAGLRWGTDNVEIAALAAPRPMKLVGASGDWTARTLTNAFPSLQMVYARVGAADRVEAEVFDFPHNYNRTSREAVYAFLGRRLIGVDDPALTVEGPTRVETPADLSVHVPGHPNPVDANTPAQLESELVGVMARQLDRLAPGVAAAPWEASRDRLMTALKIRLGIQSVPPRETTVATVRKLDVDGLKVVHVTVGRRGRGEGVPVVMLTPRGASGRLTVVLGPRGKLDLATPGGDPSPLVRALLDRGHAVVGFDPLLVGESLDPAGPAARRPSTFAHFDTYNPSLAADRAQDLATVLSWASALPEAREVHLVGLAGAGPLVLLARPVLEGVGRTMVDLGGFDYGDGSSTVPPGLDLPGVLQFGGLGGAAALACPTPLWVAGAPPGFASAWPIKAYALADAPAQLRVDREGADPSAVARWLDEGD